MRFDDGVDYHPKGMCGGNVKYRGMGMGRGIGLFVLGLLACWGAACSRSDPGAGRAAAVEVPAEHADGRRLFDARCAGCHGMGAAGTHRGPSFLSKIYEPNHHGDSAFALAVQRGVTAHHWGFGNMPPIAGLSDEEVGGIVGYVRWAQRQAGIP
ncbi:MAG: cytochrome c [Nitrospiria bacterium]